MKITLELDDRLIEIATELTGIEKPNELIRYAMKTLVQVESGRRLAALGGKDKTARAPRRRRSH